MYTRCPACQAVYELQASALAEAAGVVRCGNCGKTFNSLSQLFSEHPDESDAPISGGGMPPMLEYPDLVQGELPVDSDRAPESSEASPTHAADATDDDGRLDWLGGSESPRRLPALWPAISALLLLVLLIQFLVLWQTPGSPIARLFGGEAAPASAGDPNEAIQIIARDMHPHPSLDDAVVISTSLRNRSDARLEFPVIEVRFYDASQQVIGVRRLQPEDYIRDAQTRREGMAAGLIMPLMLEFVIGTTEPAGFQMRFF